jgi:AmmeMemoRadiSam system protein B
MVERFLGEVPAARPPGGLVKAVIAPHAGYVYSGPIAGSAFRLLAADAGLIRRVVLLGPAHRVAVAGLALPTAEAFATPLGEIPIDRELVRTVAELPQVEVSEVAHALEHSLEVELPFLQKVLADFSLLPLVVGGASPSEVREVLERVWGGPETRVVVSSDLSHYLPYEAASRLDRQTADRIERLDGPVDPRAACGAVPVSGLLLAAKKRGLKCERLDLRNSGDTAGDRSAVVGYGAFAFLEAG